MKLDVDQPNIQRSSQFVEKEFAIGNMALVLEIIRSKMYPIPVKTLIQEISSNAKDAHTERGTPDRPIEIHLPSRFSNTFAVRDYGPGITPERMGNVFIQYGNSTKRQDDNQIGGFGLGAKSPWSYTDSFGITSITPENGKNIKREYLAYIDETKIGKLALLKESETTEEQGTTIQVTTKAADEKEFLRYAHNLYAYWRIKPIIHGQSIQWKMPKTILEGKEWKIYEYLYDPYSSSMQTNCFAGGITGLINEIPYKLNINALTQLDQVTKGSISSLANSCNFVISFGPSEVSVTANREEIDYRDKTQLTISAKINNLIQEVTQKSEQEISKAKTLVEAIANYKRLPNVLRDISRNCMWKTYKVSSIRDIQRDRNKGIGIKRFTTMPGSGYANKKTSYSAPLSTTILIDDTGGKEPPVTRVLTWFSKNPKATEVYVLFPDGNGAPNFQKNLENDYPLKELNIELLSKYEKSKIVKNAASGYSIPRGYLYEGNVAYNKSIFNLDELKGTTIYCYTDDQRTTLYDDENKKSSRCSDFIFNNDFTKKNKMIIISKKFINNVIDNANFISFEKFINEKIKYYHEKYKDELANIRDFSSCTIDNMPFLVNALKSTIPLDDKEIKEFSDLCESTKKIHNKLICDESLMMISYLINNLPSNVKSKIKESREKINSRYSIIPHISIMGTSQSDLTAIMAKITNMLYKETQNAKVS